MQQALELMHTGNPTLPAWVELDKAIPEFSSMDTQEKIHYMNLYLLACYPELLRTEKTASGQGIDANKLPQDILDVQALDLASFS